MDKVLLEGKEYIKVSTAAKETGYTADYIGQLCRAGKIDAKLVGRSWYVREAEIQKHRKGKTRSNAEKTITSVREVLKSEAEQPQKRVSYTLPEYKKRLLSENINYHSDSESLIPEPIRKEVASEEEENIPPAVVVPEEEVQEEEIAIPIVRSVVAEEEIPEEEEIVEEPLPNISPEPVEPLQSISELPRVEVTISKPTVYVSKMPMLVSVFLGILVAGGLLFVEAHVSFKQGSKMEFSNGYTISSVSAVIDSFSQLK